MPTERTCGGCTACCKTHAIFELKKPPGHWCQHCQIGKGCGIYPQRPPTCRGYYCEWLAGYGKEEERPDGVNIVIEVQESRQLDRAVCLFEVKEWALNSEFAQRVTRSNLANGWPVAHLSLSGHHRVYLPPGRVIREKEIRLHYPDGSFKIMEVVPFVRGRF